MRTVKLVVVGASGVGKTSLRNQVRIPRPVLAAQLLTESWDCSISQDDSRQDTVLPLARILSRRLFRITEIPRNMLLCRSG